MGRRSRWCRFTPVLLFAWLATASVCLAQPPPPNGPPPGAIPEVDPAQYCLLKADVPGTWGWSAPHAEQRAGGSGITTPGQVETQSWWRMDLEQSLTVPVTGPDGKGLQFTFIIVGTVLKTPEYTKAAWDRWLASGKVPINLPEGVASQWSEIPSPEAFGEEAVEGAIGGKPVGVFSFRYKAYSGHVAVSFADAQTPRASPPRGW